MSGRPGQVSLAASIQFFVVLRITEIPHFGSLKFPGPSDSPAGPPAFIPRPGRLMAGAS